MEVEAVTQALEWINQSDRCRGHVIIVTDSQSMLKKIEGGLLRKEWLTSVEGGSVNAITWIFCPGHAGVDGNVQADRLAGDAEVKGDVKLDRVEVIRILEEKLRRDEEKEEGNHYAVLRMEENEIMRGEGRQGRMTGRDRRRFNQRATGTVSLDTLRSTLARRTEHLWFCPMCSDVVS